MADPSNDDNDNVDVAAKIKNDDDDFAPTTAVIMLGSMNFEPVATSDILSLKIQSPEEMSGVLEEASSSIRPNSLESVHLLLKSSSVSSLFDESILTSFYEGLIPGKEVNVHVLPESAVLAEDMPVQANDVDSIRTAMVMAGLMLHSEQAHEGSWILVAIKPGGETDDDDEDDDDDDDDDDDEKEPTESELQEEQEFRDLVAKQIENDN
ncbi:unnamed protein product [Pseudo-nitzschia multistriata]|uniref:Uncharacterized protein n=1 Tax=Pseudo-nitzschia multistriata TaxID=183589 RepID=A0A448ZCI6_9STRA|nr:unnamed protein product [Pseudo-nitzschia multistriata]